MKNFNVKYHFLALLFLGITSSSILYAQKIGAKDRIGSDISWGGEFLFDGTQLKPLSSMKHSSATINKDKNFLQFLFSMPSPSAEKVNYVRVTFHLDGDINKVVGKGKLKYESFRKDPTNSSHDNFAGPYCWDHYVKPNQFSVELRQDIKQGKYFHTYFFNCVESEANLEIKKGASDDHFYYNISFNINLIKADPPDVGGKNLKNDLNAENTLKLNGGGSFLFPGIAKK